MTHSKHFEKHDGNRDIRKLEAKGQLFFERVMCVCQVVLLGFLRPQATKGFIRDFVTTLSLFFIWDLFWGKVINPNSTFAKGKIVEKVVNYSTIIIEVWRDPSQVSIGCWLPADSSHTHCKTIHNDPFSCVLRCKTHWKFSTNMEVLEEKFKIILHWRMFWWRF